MKTRSYCFIAHAYIYRYNYIFIWSGKSATNRVYWTLKGLLLIPVAGVSTWKSVGNRNSCTKKCFLFSSYCVNGYWEENQSSASERFTHQCILKPVTKACRRWWWCRGAVTWGADGGLRGRSAGWTSKPETFFVLLFFFFFSPNSPPPQIPTGQ